MWILVGVTRWDMGWLVLTCFALARGAADPLHLRTPTREWSLPWALRTSGRSTRRRAPPVGACSLRRRLSHPSALAPPGGGVGWFVLTCLITSAALLSLTRGAVAWGATRNVHDGERYARPGPIAWRSLRPVSASIHPSALAPFGVGSRTRGRSQSCVVPPPVGTGGYPSRRRSHAWAL